MNTLIKVGVAVAGLGTVTTASYFIRDYQNTERIYKRINSSGMTLLDYNEKDKEWAKRWKDYLNDKTNVWKLKDLNEDKVPKEFKDKCYYNTSTAVEGNEKLLGEIEKYCTKSFRLADLLSKEKGVKIIAKDNKPEWIKAWKNYFEQQKSKKKNPLDITSSSEANRYPEEYSDKCLTKADREIKSTRDGDFSIVKSWCTETE